MGIVVVVALTCFLGHRRVNAISSGHLHLVSHKVCCKWKKLFVKGIRPKLTQLEAAYTQEETSGNLITRDL